MRQGPTFFQAALHRETKPVARALRRSVQTSATREFMRRLLLTCVAALAAAGATPSMASNLSGDAVKSLVGGKRVYLSTPYGLEFPLHYKRNGQVTGDASGFSLASMMAPKETGSWWIKGQKLCQKWPTWYKGKTICFTIEQTGAKSINWVRDDGLSGTARIAD